MSLWVRTMARRTPMAFTMELRRYFAIKKIEEWWLMILKRRKIGAKYIENVSR